jgi:hypothetical protein
MGTIIQIKFTMVVGQTRVIMLLAVSVAVAVGDPAVLLVVGVVGTVEGEEAPSEVVAAAEGPTRAG